MTTLQRILMTEDEGWRLYVVREIANDGTTLGAASLAVRLDTFGEWVPMSIDWHLPEAQYAATLPGRSCLALGERCQSDGSCATAEVVWGEFLRSKRDKAALQKELIGWLPRWGYPEKYQSESPEN